MKRIGIIYGMENSFPTAVVDAINARNLSDVRAEHVKIGGILMAQPSGYDVLIDRISQDIPFYRAWLKNESLHGCHVINNPFWWSADDKFFHYALAAKLGVAVPPTVMLPHREHPEGTTALAMRNLIYPLNWDEIFDYIGFPAYLKPHLHSGGRHIYRVDSPEQFFAAYNATGKLGMLLQSEVQYQDFFRCYVINREHVRIMPYDPGGALGKRYLHDLTAYSPELLARLEAEALTLCRALDYEINLVEFAVADGVPTAIDFLNPAPDADLYSVGESNFHWVVNAVADLAIARAREGKEQRADYQWSGFLRTMSAG